MLNLPSSTPESVGLDSAALAAYLRDFYTNPSLQGYVHGVAILRHGKLVSESYRAPCSPSDRHQLFSLSKSFVSSAIGIAQGEGLLSLDDKLVSFFPEYLSDNVGDRMRRVTLRNLLTMSSGHGSCALGRYQMQAPGSPAEHWIRNFLEDDLPLEPGEKFIYNSGATFMLASVVRKVSGASLLEYLRPRLFEPLGFRADLAWDRNSDGLEIGGWGLNVTLREIAAFAQLYLDGGVLPDGRRLIPAEYVKEATSKQISNGDPSSPSNWTQGYGFQFWRCRHNAFRGDGAAGQLAVCMPDQDIVVAVTAGLADMEAEVRILLDGILAAVRDAPLPENPFALADLRRAEREPRFDFGPASEPLNGFSAFTFDAAENAMGLASATLRQDEEGLSLALNFGAHGEALLHAGFSKPRTCVVSFVYEGLDFEGFGRARWTTPTTAEFRFAIPACPTFLVFTVAIGDAPSLRFNTSIWFRHDGRRNLAIPLMRRA